MADSLPDPTIDAQLRDVRLPEGFLARLQDIAALGDAQLDAELRAVEVPSDMTSRLLEIATYGDRELDFLLRDVAAPVTLRRRVVHRRPRWWKTSQTASLALAASLLVAVGLTYSLMQRAGAPHVPARGPLAVLPPAQDANLPDAGPPAETAIAETQDKNPDPASPRDVAPETEVPMLAEAPAESEEALAATGAASNLQRIFGSAEGISDEPSELEIVAAPAEGGMAPPHVREFDHLFLQRYGSFPLVDPSSHEALRTSHVPLVTSTASYDRLWREVASGRLPRGQAVRIEELLAAVDFGMPAPVDQALDIRSAAGPAVFAGDGRALLHVGVQTRDLIRSPGQATHLVVVVNVSPRASDSGRLDLIRRVLRDVVQQLASADRLTLIASPQGEAAIEQRSLEHAVEISKAIEQLDASLASSLAAQIARATHAAGQATNGVRPAIVVVSDRLSVLDGRLLSRVQSAVAEAADRSIDVSLLDVANLEGESAAALAVEEAGGRVHAVASSDLLRRQLLETLAGRSQLVAADAMFQVEFNPEAVAWYRLVGHEPQSGAGLFSSTMPATLDAGQAAGALFEVGLKPGGSADVATATARWRDPATGEPRVVQRRISRVQFASSFAGSAWSLQKAALVAELGQILRGSYFTPARNHSVERVLEVAQRAGSRLNDDPAYRDLLALLEAADRASGQSQR